MNNIKELAGHLNAKVLLAVMTLLVATPALAVTPPSGTDRTGELGMLNDLAATAWAWGLGWGFPIASFSILGISVIHFFMKRDWAALGFGGFSGILLLAIPQVLDVLGVFGT